MAVKNGEKANEHLHDGHRSRVKRQLLAGEFNNKTPSHILLEVLLYYSIPRKDTNETAHRLLKRFGTLDGVLHANESELLSIDGITENTVALFKLYDHIAARTQLEKVTDVDYIRTHEQLGNYVLKHFYGCREERVAVIFLKGNQQIIDFKFINDGDFCSVNLDARKIVKTAIMCEAAYIVIAHNHPSGIALPSQRDIEVTHGLINTMAQLGVCVADHIIVAGDDYISMAQSLEYKNLF